MNKFILFIITISILQLIHCVNDTMPGFVYTGISEHDSPIFGIIRGYPDIYLMNFVANNRRKPNSFDWDVIPTNHYYYQPITYDARKFYLGVYEINIRNLLIYDLHDTLGSRSFDPLFSISPHFHFSNVTGLALATGFNLLYWVDANEQFVGVTDFKKGRSIKVINSSLDIPYSVAVYEAKRFLFWSDIGENPKIERSNLYGGERTVIVNSSLTEPVNLVIEKYSEKLYWIDGTLKRCDFDGNNVVTYQLPKPLNYKTFIIYKDFLIVPDESAYLFITHKIVPNDTKVGDNTYFRTRLLSIASSSFDAKEFVANISNPCAYNSCNYLCLPQSDTNYVCGCSPGYILQSDGRTCSSSTLANTRTKRPKTKTAGGSSKSVGFKLLVTQFMFLTGNLF